MLDVFNNDVFGVVSLTTAIEHAPYNSTKLGKMGLFKPQGITTLSAAIDIKDGTISVYSTGARGASVNTHKSDSKYTKSFSVPHIPVEGEVKADEVQGVRAFGSETQLETVSGVVAEKTKSIRQSFEATFEFHRANALQGKLLDADGSTLYDWFAEFGLTREVVDFNFSSATADIKQLCLNVKRLIEDALGATTFSGIRALCGKDWFDAFVSHAKVVDAYLRWRDGEYLRTQQGGRDAPGFVFGEIEFVEYRVQIGTLLYLAADEATFFPVGVNNLFGVYFAPANYSETVNTKGKPFYMKKERQRFDTGVDLHAQSNPLFIPHRPGCLISGTKS